MDIPTKPNKHFRLICWFLLYKIPAAEPLILPSHEEEACVHCGISREDLRRLQEAYPDAWTRLMEKRARRLMFRQTHGYVPDSWTPPDPKDGRSGNYPAFALGKRGKSGEEAEQRIAAVIRSKWNAQALKGERLSAIDSPCFAPARIMRRRTRERSNCKLHVRRSGPA